MTPAFMPEMYELLMQRLLLPLPPLPLPLLHQEAMLAAQEKAAQRVALLTLGLGLALQVVATLLAVPATAEMAAQETAAQRVALLTLVLGLELQVAAVQGVDQAAAEMAAQETAAQRVTPIIRAA